MKEFLSQTKILQKLRENEISLFTVSDFKKIFGIKKENTAYKIIERLTKKGIFKRLIKRKYLFAFSDYNDFQIANFLYSPSYISLESALSFYGIITQFPYQITSVTPKKTKKIVALGKEFSFSHLKPKLFLGFEKKDNFLIALPEKAIFDYLYFVFKGLRIFKKDDFDLKKIEKRKFWEFVKKADNKKFDKFIRELNL